MLAVDFLAMNSFLLDKSFLSKPRTLMLCLLLITYLALQRSLEGLFPTFLLSLQAVTHPQSADMEETS